jgi:cytosine/adenosine deaminase-related metal-dependent hydrolase
MSAIALQARYIFPVDSPPIRDGVMTVDGERMVAVGENASGRPPHDLGNVAILPGLVNAHTHLEFSDLDAPLGDAGMPFPQWIQRVVASRRQRGEQADDPAAQRAAAVERGLAESLACGTTTLGEIARPLWPREVFERQPLDCTVFLELLGLSNERIEPLLQSAREHLDASRQTGAKWRAGLSPHAPYTASPDLVARISQLSAESHVPVAMHLAESVEELELLQSHSGPFVELLAELDAWHPGAIPRGIRPLDYLQLLSSAHRALVIHGNYLSDAEIGFLAEHADRMSVVYCPRTHAYFGHGRYPLARMLAAGVNVALGTDSRASNPDLNLLAELHHIAYSHSDVQAADVLRLGTLGGARALGRDDQCGSLTAGKLANLTLVKLPDHDADDPHELLFDATALIDRVYTARGRN